MKFFVLVIFVLFKPGFGYFPKFEIPKIIPDIVPEVVDKINPLNLLFFNKCIEDLGCFHTGPPFYHASVRPITLPPQEPLTKFQLYTPDNPDEQYNLTIDIESLRNSPFNPDLPTKFIIHGFRSDVRDLNDIRHEIKQALLKQGQYNVIIVDWTENNGFPYAQAASNTNNTGIEPQTVHVIGHSLGGQIAGYVGERVPNLGRITGLDPAGPFFQGLHTSVRLDTTDALFVDVIHSDGGEYVLNGLGTSAPIGHIDFYPNGGRRQPGCFYASESENIVGATVNFTTKWLSNSCDHGRANEYFLESINNSNCKFLAVQCSSYKDFEKGLCSPNNSTINEMGFHAVQLPNLDLPAKFYLRTNASSPYCIEDSILL
nr:pancreatic triacylglycerol lipase [Parasteatoda tepidariorum]